MRVTVKALGMGACLVVCAGLVPAEAAAQAPVRSDSPWTVEAAGAAWTDAVPVSLSLAPAEPMPSIAAPKDKETGLTLIIVGGAMFVGGLVIGDTGGTLLAVGGVGVGAYGLYLYLD
jgi:hypothetical protein